MHYVSMFQCWNLLHPEGAETLQNVIKQRFSENQLKSNKTMHL